MVPLPTSTSESGLELGHSPQVVILIDVDEWVHTHGASVSFNAMYFSRTRQQGGITRSSTLQGH
jgi:hypothetical protein